MLKITFWNNTTQDYLISFGLFLLFWIIFQFIQSVILKKLNKLSQKTATDIDDTFIQIIKNIKPGFYAFISFFLAIKNLILSELATTLINWILIIWATYLAIMALQVLIDYALRQKIKSESDNTKQALRTLGLLTKGILWILGGLFVLSNMGIDVTSAMAGLGIGGIAIALAIQNILGDLFSSFAIYFDKPFEVGDLIVVGDKIGTVEKIGIKTTRLRALQGEEIIISNKELTAAQIQNFKKMEERRIVFTFGVTYDTPTDKLKKIPTIVGNIFQQTELTRLDRVHFHRFDDSALTYETVYYIESAEYNIYMDVQQTINLKIKEQFDQENIEMAFPTQTIHLIKN